jgi:peptidylprolyl isomerase
MKKLVIILLLFSTLGISAQNQATFYTDQGDFVIELYDWRMPVTTTNFRNLVTSNFYDSTIFHRVIDDFIIQGGNAAITGGNSASVIQDEFDSTTSNVKFTIAMANSGPNTGTSQFFINLKDNTYLDFDKPPSTSKHPVFGEVVSGSSVVTAIGGVAVNSNDRPLTNLFIDSIRMTYLIPTGIETIYLKSDQFKVFPNPILSNQNLKLNISKSENYEICIYNIHGQKVFNKNLNLSKGINNLSIPTFNQLKAGNYFLTCSSDFDNFKAQLVIK